MADAYKLQLAQGMAGQQPTKNRIPSFQIAPGARQESVSNNQIAQPQAPQLTPQQAQINYAKEFESNRPMMASKLMGDLGSGLNEQMGSNIKSLREGAASRGLLHSGLRRGAEQGERAKTASQLSQGRLEIGEALRKQSQSLNDQAVQSGLDIQRSSQQMADIAYQEALANMSRKNSAMGGLFGAAGTAIGAWYGGAGGAAAGGAVGSQIGSNING